MAGFRLKRHDLAHAPAPHAQDKRIEEVGGPGRFGAVGGGVVEDEGEILEGQPLLAISREVIVVGEENGNEGLAGVLLGDDALDRLLELAATPAEQGEG